MPGTDSAAQPPEKRPSNRDRRPKIRKSARAPFPILTDVDESEKVRGAVLRTTSELDTSDPAAGGGRSFRYQWEEEASRLRQQIQDVAAGGGGSGGGAAYVHYQSTAAATWVIDHHLGLIPNVVVLDTTGQELFAELRFPSDQTVVVVHSAPYSGTAYLRP